MLILISPAKKLNIEPIQSLINPKKINFENNLISFPKFLDKSEILIDILKKCSPLMLSGIMNISADLAELNFERFQIWSKNHESYFNNKPALFMFNGDVYEGIDALTLTSEQIIKAQKHLRILSGLYGILKPLDHVQPYRLEMGTKLEFDKSQNPNLYTFWGDAQTDYITEEMSEYKSHSRIIINLASDEYFKVINTKKLINNDIKIIKINFEQNKNGIYKNISFLTKYARGLMVKFILQNNIKTIQDLLKFNLDGYSLFTEHSKQDNLIFRKDN